MSAKEVAVQIIQSPKTGAVISAATTGTGLGTFLEWVPDDIGKLATLVGIVLSITLIRVHLLGVKKVKLELEILRKKEAARLEAEGRGD